MPLSPFTQTDWYAFAGATSFGDHKPMIHHDPAGRFVVILAGDGEGWFNTWININFNLEETDGEYCYVEFDKSLSWDQAVEVTNKWCHDLSENDLATWTLVRNLMKPV